MSASASSPLSSSAIDSSSLLRTHVRCEAAGCCLPPPRALGGRFCAVHRCIHCAQRKDPSKACCHECLKRAADAPAASSSSSSSSSSALSSPLDWSHRCRHVSGETEWTRDAPGSLGVPCGEPSAAGAIYCARHLCSQCLGDLWDGVGTKPLYPCCTQGECAWPRVAALQDSTAVEITPSNESEAAASSSSPRVRSSAASSSSSSASPPTARSVMLSVARLILHRLPERCLIYGGFVRDYLLRDETAKDLDVVVCLPQVQAGPNTRCKTEKDAALERLRLVQACADALQSAVTRLSPPLIETSRVSKPPSSCSRDYLVVQMFAPAGGAGPEVQVEYCVAGSYPPGEVDADINNLAVASGCSLMPRDAALPFSPPHALRHVAAKQFAYVRQRGWKVGVGRLYKLLVEKGWTKVAKIPCVHPLHSDHALDAYRPAGEWTQPEWTVCPRARQEFEIA